MPRVSVIIPTYQRPKRLFEAVQSVLAQSYTDFEVIIVKDEEGFDPNDQLWEIVDSRVRYFAQQHAGRSVARNRGIAEARGELIAFLDDDDLYLPHKLASEVTFLDAHPDVALVASGTRFTFPNSKNIMVLCPVKTDPPPGLLALLGGCLFATCSVMLRKAAMDGMDSWFDPLLDFSEDWDFYLRFALTGARMAWLPDVVSVCASIRDGPASALLHHNQCGKQILDRLFAQPDIPSEVRKQQKGIYAHFHIICACRAYSCKCIHLAHRELLRALILNPKPVDESKKQIYEVIVKFAQNLFLQEESEAYIDYVFDHLPAPLAHRPLQGEQVKSRRFAMPPVDLAYS